MHIIIWQYVVKHERRSEFQRFYSSEGAWTELFIKSAGYLGTELLHDTSNPDRFITIDRWESEETYRTFHTQYWNEYQRLDKVCESLTESEALIGTFSLP